MKVIDLLNKIANGEEVPNEIKKDGMIYIYQEGIDYINKETSKWLMNDYYITEENLNEKVEIIEEDKEIKKIDFKTAETQKEKNRVMKDKINELVREVNKLKKEDK